jgi:hypothetical protein
MLTIENPEQRLPYRPPIDDLRENVTLWCEPCCFVAWYRGEFILGLDEKSEAEDLNKVPGI